MPNFYHRKIAWKNILFQENKACFWNPTLVEAINSTKYVGYIKPSTLFITSMSERYMQTLRDAWIRRILKPAKGYRIETVGKHFLSMISD